MIRATIGIFSQGGVAIDADAQAFFDRVDTAGGSLSTTEQQAVNTLVIQMKADGIWAKMKAIYPMVGASAAACAQNLKSSSFTGTFYGGWTFASTGVTPNGTNGYMATSFVASTNLTKGDGHLSYYSRTNSATSVSTTMGDNTGGRGRIILRRVGDIAYIECGTNNASSRSYTVTDSRCFAVANVILNQNVDFFQNGVKQTAIAVFDTNDGWSTSQIGVGGYPGAQYDDKECALASIGDGLTDTEASDFYTAVQAFNTTLSRQV